MERVEKRNKMMVNWKCLQFTAKQNKKVVILLSKRLGGLVVMTMISVRAFHVCTCMSLQVWTTRCGDRSDPLYGQAQHWVSEWVVDMLRLRWLHHHSLNCGWRVKVITLMDLNGRKDHRWDVTVKAGGDDGDVRCRTKNETNRRNWDGIMDVSSELNLFHAADRRCRLSLRPLRLLTSGRSAVNHRQSTRSVKCSLFRSDCHVTKLILRVARLVDSLRSQGHS